MLARVPPPPRVVRRCRWRSSSVWISGEKPAAATDKAPRDIVNHEHEHERGTTDRQSGLLLAPAKITGRSSRFGHGHSRTQMPPPLPRARKGCSERLRHQTPEARRSPRGRGRRKTGLCESVNSQHNKSQRKRQAARRWPSSGARLCRRLRTTAKVTKLDIQKFAPAPAHVRRWSWEWQAGCMAKPDAPSVLAPERLARLR